jgi:hypothetical protein
MKISGAIPASSEHRHTLEQLGADPLALLEQHGETDEPRHHCPDPWLLGDPAQLGALEGPL